MAHIIYPRGASYRRSSFYKLLSSLLIASFLLPASVMAQIAEGNSQAAETPQGNTSPGTPPPESTASPLPDNASPKAEEAISRAPGTEIRFSSPEAARGNFDRKPEKPNVKNPEDAVFSLSSVTGTGTLYDPNRENLSRDFSGGPDAMGAFTQSYPIVSPPGRNGLDPKLELQYSSNRTEEGALYGYGWADNIPYIERLNKKGTDKFFTGDYSFVSSLDGELLPTVVGTTTSFGPKVENGAFRKYSLSGSQWTVTDKRGMTYKFGINAATRQDNPSNSSQVSKWMLEEVRDTNNNYIKYEYFKDNGQIYPSKIIYTGNGTTDGIFEIEFLREARLDMATSTKPSFITVTKYRINEIRTKVNSQTARKYVLSYIGGDAGTFTGYGNRALLSTITETAYDEGGGSIVLPATTFEYSKTVTGGWTRVGDSPQFIASTGNDVGYIVADVNGDGLADLVRGYGSSYSAAPSIGEVALNTGLGYWSTTSWTVPRPFRLSNGQDAGTRLVDVNGDLLPDIIQGVMQQTATGVDYIKKAYINNGAGWTENSSWIPPVSFTFVKTDGTHIPTGARIMDENGDGLADLLMRAEIDPIIPQSENGPWLNTGSGWSSSNGIPYVFDGPDSGVRIGDINNDGMSDLMDSVGNKSSGLPYRAQVWSYTPNGAGTWTPQYANVGEDGAHKILPRPFTFADDYTVVGWDAGSRLIDANGDGLNDILQSFRDTTGSLTGAQRMNKSPGVETWFFSTNWTVPVSFSVFDTAGNNYDGGARIEDVNGDGMPDILKGISSTIESDTVNGNGVYYNNSKQVDLITKITASTGGKTTIAYKPTAQMMNGSTLKNPKLPFTLYAVDAIATDDSFGTIGTTTYSYEGGEYYFGGAFDRQFAGFSKIIKTDPAGNKTTSFYHQGNASDSALGENSDHISKAGKAYRVEEADGSGNLYKKTITRWGRFDLGNGRNFVKPLQTQVSDYDGNAGAKSKGEAYTFSDTTGNLTQKIEYGEVTGSDNGLFSDTGSDKFTTDISYASGGSVTGLPSTETTVNQSSAKVKETRHYYDGLALGSVTKGNETKTEFWKSTTTYIDTEKTYNTYGLIAQEKDPRDNATNYTYDTNNLYPATVTNALSHVRSLEYDYSSGKVKRLTDENNRVFETTYDALDRVKEEKQPDITTPSTFITKALYTYVDTQNAKSVQKSNSLDGTNIVDEYTYLDGLDRVIQKRREAEDANTFAVSDFKYNTRGLLEKESLPYFSTGSARTTATTNNALYTTYSYDPLQRISSVARVIGNETRAYDDWKTTITDPRSNPKSLYSDAYGNLIKVDEINGGSTYTTTYTYNYLKNLATTTDAVGNVRGFTYDGLGRRLTAQDLHAPADSTFGTYTYTYDDAGNMTQKVDPKGQIVNYTYDVLNRVSTEDWTGGTGTEATYTYDTGTDGKTRLTQAVFTGSATTDYAYNPLGLTKTETKAITGGSSYTTTYDYDRQGNNTQITYPDNAQVKYTYNNGGLLEKVEEKESGGSFANIVSDFDYAPTGEVSFKKFANGVESTYTYDANELYRLRNMHTEKFGGVLGASFTRLKRAFMSFLGLDSTPLKKILAASATAPEAVPMRTESESLESLDVKEKKTRPETSDTFEIVKDRPEVRLSKWNGEVNVGVSYKKVKANATREPFTGKLQWKGEKEEVHAYPIAAKAGLEDGGFEIEVSLKEKPDTNTFDFTIDGAEDLDFFYQPELTKEEISEGAERPENVIGSYAVYHKTKVNHQKGGTNYGTGKIFHIYRPKAIDAKGKETWGTLSYANGTLTVTVPQDFLDKAAYPVIVDPTFGYATAGASSANTTLATGSKYSIPENGTVSQLTVYTKASSTTVSVGAAMYSDNAGAPNALLTSHTSTPSQGTTASWVNVPVTSYAATGGMNYWLWGWSSGSRTVYWDSGATNQYNIQGMTWPNWANPITPGTYFARKTSIYATYTASGNSAPTAPTSLETEGQTNPVNISDTTPEFSAIYNDPNTSDTAGFYKIQVATSTSFTSNVWDSGKTTMTATAQGTRSPLISYAGPTLTTGTTYYWRIKFWDAADAEGAWSTATASFSLAAGGGSATKLFQDITYTYDANGNITNIADRSDTGAGKTVAYGYDPLNRLTSANTTAASSTPYTHSYGYTPIGNIASSTPAGSYSYAGTNYANPHAATSIGGITHAYDNNGNLTSDGTWTHSWNYRNNLTQSTNGTITTTYAYDHAGNRVKLAEGSTTTFFPNKLYETSSSKTTKHIFDTRGNILATVETGGGGGTGTTTTHTVYTDSLNNWENWSWNTTLDPSNTSPVRTGTYSLKSTHNADWGGMYLHHNGVNTATSTHLSFSVRVPDAGASIVMESYGPTDNILAQVPLNNYIPGGSMAADTWYDVNIPLADLSATNTTLRGIVAMRSTAGTAYWDDIKLIAQGSGGGGGTTIRYVHTDHLTGSNVVTDASGVLAETLDYYPYGGMRIDDKVGGYGGERRKYAGTEYDGNTGLNYMQARYYNPARGQFLSEDPVHIAIGDAGRLHSLTGQNQEYFLSDPQSLNSYLYARGNPIRYSDPQGLWFKEFLTGRQSWSSFQVELGDAANQMAQDSPAWNFALEHPYASGALVGLLSAPAATAGVGGTVALRHVVYPGVGMAYSASRAIEGTAYLYLAQDTIKTIPSVLTDLSKVNLNNPSIKSVLPAVGKTTFEVAPVFAGEKLQGIADLVNLATSLVNDLKRKVDQLVNSKKK